MHCEMKVKISIPPVEPPPWNVIEQPTPTVIPPSKPITSKKPPSTIFNWDKFVMITFYKTKPLPSPNKTFKNSGKIDVLKNIEMKIG